MSTKTKPCDCPVAGYCTRHQMEKRGRLYQLCQTNSRYREMWDRLAAGLPPAEISMVSKVLQLNDALQKWHKAGKPTRSEEEIKQIFDDHCLQCTHYKPSTVEGSGTCDLCKCSLHRIGGLINKIAMATEACPINKWEATA